MKNILIKTLFGLVQFVFLMTAIIAVGLAMSVLVSCNVDLKVRQSFDEGYQLGCQDAGKTEKECDDLHFANKRGKAYEPVFNR